MSAADELAACRAAFDHMEVAYHREHAERVRLGCIVDLACDRHLAFRRYQQAVSAGSEAAVYATGRALNEAVAAEVARRAEV